MSRHMIVPLLFGLIGAAILIGLGSWQVQRLHWKETMLAEIDARIHADPMPLPANPNPIADRFLPVMVDGELTGEGTLVLVSRKEIGAGYRMIAVLQISDGRRVLVDQGFVAEGEPRDFAIGPAHVVGNLHWPSEVDSYTPAPDTGRNLWFARDVAAMAAVLKAEPLFIVARAPVRDGIEPMAVDTSTIPNDHLGYAATWFMLAAGWLGMTVLYLWRIRRKTA